MLHGVNELLFAEYIDIQMARALIEIAVHHGYQVLLLFLLAVSESTRVDGLGIGDTVQRILIGQLRHRIQRSQQAVLLCAIAGVRTRCQRLACTASVRHIAGGLAVYHVGGNGQDRGSRLGIPVGVTFFKLLQEGLQEPYRDIVRTVIVVAVARKIALYLIVYNQAFLIPDGPYLCVTDSA